MRFDVVTFNVRYRTNSNRIKTTITIFGDLIQCPLTEPILFDELQEIRINDFEKEMYREKSFTFMFREHAFHFVAENRKERDQILFKILTRFPANNTNRAHLETIQWARNERVLVIDRNEDVYGCEVPDVGDMMPDVSGHDDAMDGMKVTTKLQDKLSFPDISNISNISNISQNDKHLESGTSSEPDVFQPFHAHNGCDVQLETTKWEHQRKEIERQDQDEWDKKIKLLRAEAERVEIACAQVFGINGMPKKVKISRKSEKTLEMPGQISNFQEMSEDVEQPDFMRIRLEKEGSNLVATYHDLELNTTNEECTPMENQSVTRFYENVTNVTNICEDPEKVTNNFKSCIPDSMRQSFQELDQKLLMMTQYVQRMKPQKDSKMKHHDLVHHDIQTTFGEKCETLDNDKTTTKEKPHSDAEAELISVILNDHGKSGKKFLVSVQDVAAKMQNGAGNHDADPKLELHELPQTEGILCEPKMSEISKNFPEHKSKKIEYEFMRPDDWNGKYEFMRPVQGLVHSVLPIIEEDQSKDGNGLYLSFYDQRLKSLKDMAAGKPTKPCDGSICQNIKKMKPQSSMSARELSIKVGEMIHPLKKRVQSHKRRQSHIAWQRAKLQRAQEEVNHARSLFKLEKTKWTANVKENNKAQQKLKHLREKLKNEQQNLTLQEQQLQIVERQLEAEKEGLSTLKTTCIAVCNRKRAATCSHDMCTQRRYRTLYPSRSHANKLKVRSWKSRSRYYEEYDSVDRDFDLQSQAWSGVNGRRKTVTLRSWQ